jgi:peptide deformylase
VNNPCISQAGDPVLRMKAAPVTPERLRSRELDALVETMVATMREANGVGLAAPQIGVPLQVFVFEESEKVLAMSPEERAEKERFPFALTVFLNPTMRVIGDERTTFFEGCLSINGYTALVTRSREVEISGLDRQGDPQTLSLRGWPARIAQHEYDHLQGILFTDRMIPRSLMTVEHLRGRFMGKRIAEIMQELGVSGEEPPVY